MHYEKYSGTLIGIAGIIRPYAFIYAVVLEGKQRIIPFLFGIALVLAMIATGGFTAYFHETFGYAKDVGGAIAWIDQRTTTVYFYLILLAVLMCMSYSKSKYYRWGLVACIPLILRTYEHYFTPAILIFFYLYLLEKNKSSVAGEFKTQLAVIPKGGARRTYKRAHTKCQ